MSHSRQHGLSGKPKCEYKYPGRVNLFLCCYTPAM